MGLFELGDFTSHSGKLLHWKIECESLTDDDWDCLAFMIQEKQEFQEVIGIPRGGIPLAEALDKYKTFNMSAPLLIVDDVLTTGNSFLEFDRGRGLCPYIVRWVVFSRIDPPNGINSLFTMR